MTRQWLFTIYYKNSQRKQEGIVWLQEKLVAVKNIHIEENY